MMGRLVVALMWMLVVDHMEPVAGWGRRRRRLKFDGCTSSEESEIRDAMSWLGQSSSKCKIDAQMGRNNLWTWNSDRRRTQEASWRSKVDKRPRTFKCSRRRRRNPGWIGRVVPPLSTIQLNMAGYSQDAYRSVIAHEIGHFVIWHSHRNGQRVCTQPRIAESVGNAAMWASAAPSTGWSCSDCIGYTRRRRGVRRRGCASATPSIDVSGCTRRLSEGAIGSDSLGEVHEFEQNTSARRLRTMDEIEKELIELGKLDRPMTKRQLLQEAEEFIGMYDLDKDGKLSELELLEDYDPPEGYEDLTAPLEDENPNDEEKDKEVELPSKFHFHFMRADSLSQRCDGALDVEELVEFFKAFQASYLDFAKAQKDDPDENNQEVNDNGKRRLLDNDEPDEVDEPDEPDEVGEADEVDEVDEVDEIDEPDELNV